MTIAFKFTDRDVRRRADLYEIAVIYAAYYDGDFQFMRDAAAVVAATGGLPVAMARGVLNCLRADTDPLVADLHDEIAEALPRRERPPPALEIVHPPTRKVVVDTRCTLHSEVGVARNGKVLHIINHEQSYVRWQMLWHPGNAGWIPLPQPSGTLYVAWRCGTHTQNPRLFSRHWVNLAGWPHCKSGCWEDE